MQSVTLAAGQIITEERSRNLDVAQVWTIRCWDMQATQATRIGFTSDFAAIWSCDRCGKQHTGNTVIR